jgi:hypothetical protein
MTVGIQEEIQSTVASWEKEDDSAENNVEELPRQHQARRHLLLRGYLWSEEVVQPKQLINEIIETRAGRDGPTRPRRPDKGVVADGKNIDTEIWLVHYDRR